jgi:hypothetical protein
VKNDTLFLNTLAHRLGEGVKMPRTLLTRVSEFLICTLIVIGLIVQLFAIPQISSRLAALYTEYSSDETVIQIMLTVIVLSGQLSLGFIALLLTKIRGKNLVSESTLKWVRALSASLFAVAATFTFLLA